MSEHKGLPVHGYLPQSEDKVEIVNANKVSEELLLRRIEMLDQSGLCDRRCLALAKTGIQEAFMWLNRAVFQPARINLPEDGQQ